FLDLVAHVFLAFGALPVEFAVPPVTDVSFFVDNVHAGPHAVAPGGPILEPVVDGDGEVEFFLLRLFLDALKHLFVRPFGRVDADDRHALLAEPVLPTPVPGVIADAVDSPKRP